MQSLVAHDCGYPLSRYTCRATPVAADFLDFIAFCRCSTGVALHPLKILVSHLPPPPVRREVSHRNLGLKRCRATRGCRSDSCGVSRYTVQLRCKGLFWDTHSKGPKTRFELCLSTLGLVVRIARPASLAFWHRGHSHRRPNRSGSPNRRHFASLDRKRRPS